MILSHFLQSYTPIDGCTARRIPPSPNSSQWISKQQYPTLKLCIFFLSNLHESLKHVINVRYERQQTRQWWFPCIDQSMEVSSVRWSGPIQHSYDSTHKTWTNQNSSLRSDPKELHPAVEDFLLFRTLYLSLGPHATDTQLRTIEGFGIFTSALRRCLIIWMIDPERLANLRCHSVSLRGLQPLLCDFFFSGSHGFF